MSVYRVGGNKSSQNVFPSVRPTLDLDFANSKTLDPRITFTRASGGSYVGADGLIKYAGVNEARFDHDPATGESLGLLIEESRQNLLTYSEDFGSGSWSKLNCSANTTNILSPSGSQSTNIFVPDQMQSNNLIAIVRNGVPVVSNNTYTLSLYIKNGGYNNLVLFVDNIKSSGPARTGALYRMTGTSGVSFSSSNLNTANVDTTHSIQKINNDWYKIFLTFPVETNSIGVNFRFTNDGVGYINTNGDGTSGIYIWGAQLEQGAFPTSYIPTQGSTRTRAVDNASITGKNFSEWYRQDEGTIYCEVTHGLTNYRAMFYSISRGLTNNYNIQYYKEPLTSLLYNSNITNQDFIGWNSYGTVPYNKSVKTARSYIENNLIHSINGNIFNTVVSSAFGTRQPGGYKVKIPVELNRLTIGNHPTVGSSYQNGTIKRFTYYPKVLSPEQLIALTR
jgi:hypothetical protein